MTCVIGVERNDNVLTIRLDDAATVSYPASFVPSLRSATKEQFMDYQALGNRIHWRQLGFTLLFVVPLLSYSQA